MANYISKIKEQLTFENIMMTAVKTPGVKIKRDVFLRKELRKYYACADLFVLCTREDIWGLVIQEAMSYGLPVISSDNCVAAEHFSKQDESVVVCSNEDEEAYGVQIRKVFEDPEYRESLSEKALLQVRSYTIENSAQDIINDLSLL